MSGIKPNSLAVKAPHLRGEWSPENTVSFDDATCGEHTKYKWVCPAFGHPYEAAPYNRVAKKPKGCPECSGRRTSIVNSLATRAPWLECEWHPDNKEKFHETAYSSNKKCKWVCRKYKHVWTATPANRTGKMRGGCPDCSHRRVSELNSLATRAPWLECEWHPDNKEKFHEVAYRSGKRYKWKCSKCQHVWMATPCNRTAPNPRGCPRCPRRPKPASEYNSLATKAPHLECEWHISNQVKFRDMAFRSGVKCNWICSKGHVWAAPPYNRTARIPSGCPECAITHSKSELIVFNAVQEKYPDAVSGQRGLLRPKQMELDIYIPSLKKAVEYDGTYWHSKPEAKAKDQRKNEQCVQTGIQLLRIPEAEYETDPPGTIVKVLAWLAAP